MANWLGRTHQCFEAAARTRPVSLSESEGRIAEQMINGDHLWEGAGIGIGCLGREHGVAEACVTAGDELVEKGSMKDVSGVVDAEAARGECGDGALAVRCRGGWLESETVTQCGAPLPTGSVVSKGCRPAGRRS